MVHKQHIELIMQGVLSFCAAGSEPGLKQRFKIHKEESGARDKVNREGNIFFLKSYLNSKKLFIKVFRT